MTWSLRLTLTILQCGQHTNIISCWNKVRLTGKSSNESTVHLSRLTYGLKCRQTDVGSNPLRLSLLFKSRCGVGQYCFRVSDILLNHSSSMRQFIERHTFVAQSLRRRDIIMVECHSLSLSLCLSSNTDVELIRCSAALFTGCMLIMYN